MIDFPKEWAGPEKPKEFPPFSEFMASQGPDTSDIARDAVDALTAPPDQRERRSGIDYVELRSKRQAIVEQVVGAKEWLAGGEAGVHITSPGAQACLEGMAGKDSRDWKDAASLGKEMSERIDGVLDEATRYVTPGISAEEQEHRVQWRPDAKERGVLQTTVLELKPEDLKLGAAVFGEGMRVFLARDYVPPPPEEKGVREFEGGTGRKYPWKGGSKFYIVRIKEGKTLRV